MGGRGSSGATYTQKKRIGNHVRKLEQKTKALRASAAAYAETQVQKDIADALERSKQYSWSSYELTPKEVAELKHEYATEWLNNTDYDVLTKQLGEKRKMLKELNQGQRVLF